MSLRKIRGSFAKLLVVSFVFSITTQNAHSDIVLSDGVDFFAFAGFPLDRTGPDTIGGDYTLPDAGFVRLRHLFESTAALTVNGGSTLQSAVGLYTSVFDTSGKAEIYVDGAGSRIEIGAGTISRGNIRLNGWGDFDITNGAVVRWAGTANCDGVFFSCDILIGATAESNTGIRVIGAGSLLDASNTNGRLFVGYVPSPTAYSSDENVVADSEDFLVIQDSGVVILSGGGSVGKGFEGPGWNAGVGYVQGTVFVDDGLWQVTGDPGADSVLNIGEGDGGSGNVFVVNGGVIDFTASSGEEAGFYLGQTEDGVPTEGGSNLLVVDTGAVLRVDNNSGVVGGSRIANGFATVQNGGAIEIDSSVLLVSGNSGAALSEFNTTLANKVGISGVSNINLDVSSGGSVTLSDNDNTSVGALVIGQTPNVGPTQSARVVVSGGGSNITVDNTSKIALAATAFGIPVVSNIGTGSLVIEDGGTITFNNGDFVIAARTGDDAEVIVDNSALTADRVIVGWTDYEGGVVNVGTSTGVLELTDGIIEGDVVVDDNGCLGGVGTINGTLFAEGGCIDPGFSPGTITVESLILGAGSELIMEVGLNSDGSINAAASDSIIATTGDLDLSTGNVQFELYAVDASMTVAEILGGTEVLLVTELFQSSEDVVLGSYDLTDASGSISDDVLNQLLELVSYDKSACKKGGWQSLTRSDGSGFKNQGRCIRYVNNGF